MKVLFIRPKPPVDTIGLQHIMIVEPLELEILATLIEKEHQVEIYDMILETDSLETIIMRSKPEVLCFSGYITHIPVIIENCKRAKDILPLVITITGGVHVEKFPEDINSEYIDYRLVRNATINFPLLIAHITKTAPLPQGVLKQNEALDESNLPDYNFFTPIPNRSLTQKYRNKYFYVFHNKVALIKTSFGCPYKCKFCYCRIITGNNYFPRPLAEVINELLTIKEKEVYIVDDDFLVNEKRLREFLHLLKVNGIEKKYLVYGRADFIASHPELISDFKKQGLRTVIVGLESFDNVELNEFNKQTDSTTNKMAMSVLNKNKVDCYAAIIISPSWTKTDFQKAGMMMLDLGIKFVNLQPLTPLKGTGISVSTEDLVVARDDFAKWDLAHVTIRPERMSLEDFYKNILWLYMLIVRNPKNIISFLKYPLHMQIKLARGMSKVKNQYLKQIINAA
jgi:hopanoid C-3 methylase